MGALQNILEANRLADPPVEKYARVGPVIAEAGYGGSVDPLGNTNDFLRTYAEISWVYAAVYQIQVNIAKLPLKVYVGPKDEDRKDITDDPKFAVLKKPHPFKSRFIFWMEVFGNLELTGEVFCYLVRDNENQPPKEIIPLRSDRIKIVPHATNYIKGYVYSQQGKDVPFEPWEIFHLNYYNPTDDYRGMSPLQAARNDMILELHSVSWAKDFFKNGMRPTGILEAPSTLSDSAFKKTQKQFDKKYAGTQKTLLLQEGTKYTPLSLPPKDVEFLEQRKMTKGTVLAAFGVPPIMIMDLSDSSILQNTEIQRRIFWQETLSHKMAMFLEEWNTELMPLFGIDGAYVEFNTSGIEELQEDKEKKEKRYWEGFAKGSVTPNEIRTDVFGKDALSDSAMDATYLPINLLPTGSSIIPGSKKTLTRAADDEDDDVRLALWKLFVSRTVGYELKFTDKVATLFRELRNEVIAKWKNTKSYTHHSNKYFLVFTKKDIDVSGALFDDEEWKIKFNEMGLPLIAEAIRQGGTRVLEDLASEVVFNIADPFVIDTITNRLELFGTSVVGTTRKQIVKEITAGMNAAETVDEIAKRLAKVFDHAEKYRAPRIARTEVVSGYNAGNLEGMRQSQAIDEHWWLTSRDEDVRDSHKLAADGSLMDGKSVKLGEEFPLSTEYTGFSKEYPSDYNERCTTMPKRKNEE